MYYYRKHKFTSLLLLQVYVNLIIKKKLTSMDTCLEMSAYSGELNIPPFNIKYAFDGFVTALKIEYNGATRDAEFRNGGAGYRGWVDKYFTYFGKDTSTLGNRRRETVLAKYTLNEEQEWLEHCLKLIFEYISQILQQYGRSFFDYFVEVRREYERGKKIDDTTLPGWLTIQAAHIVVHCNLDYKIPLDVQEMKI
jgi:hypothetical protein